jgi:hypothetical protein
MLSASRLPWPDCAAAVSACERGLHLGAVARGLDLLQAGDLPSRTLTLSTSRISTGSSLASLYLLTPTMTSLPLSMRACFSAALASILSLAQPLSTAWVMPPMASTSSMMAQALSAMSWVSFSIR